MTKQDYLKLLVEGIHSTTIATIGADSHPQTRVIDMMLWDEQGVYFLTAKGKAFYAQLMEQGFIALSATKDKISISLRGKIRNIGSEKLDEIFEKNTYMQSIYPGDTRSALEVFCLYEADGEYFDISDPNQPLWKFFFTHWDGVEQRQYVVRLQVETGEVIKAFEYTSDCESYERF